MEGVNDMNTISIQDIINGEFNYSSFPAIAWGEFGAVYYVDAVGIDSDNNIYLARSYEELNSRKQNQIYIRRCICGISDFLKMMRDIHFLIGNVIDNNINVYVKDCKGYVLPIKEAVEDEDSNKIVFVTDSVKDI